MAGRAFFGLTIVFIAMWWFFRAFPEVDLAISAIYFRDGQWVGTKEPWAFLREVYYRGSIWLGVYACIIAIISFWRPFEMGAYFYRLFAMLTVLGNLLLVNQGFKEYFGRARPYKTTEFGGDKLFTPPPLAPAGQCEHNCSFISGEASGAMILILIGVALAGASRRGKIIAWLVFLPMAWMRIMAGKHFFSDVVMSMVFTAMVYWFLLMVTGKTSRDLWGSWRIFGADFLSLFRRKRGNQDEA